MAASWVSLFFLHFDQRFTTMTQWWSFSKSVTLEEEEQEATTIIIDTIVIGEHVINLIVSQLECQGDLHDFRMIFDRCD